MRELFIYYRATIENAGAVRAQVSTLQAALRTRHPGLQARLMRRPEAANGMHTWMETYAAPMLPEGISDSMQADIETAARVLVPFISGSRHTESFDACA